MLKILILCLLFSFSAFGNYAKLSEAQSNSISKVWVKKPSCGVNCIKIPFGYNSNYYTVIDETINDISSPINSKNDIEACIDQTDCESKNAVKVCTDNLETVYMAGDFSEIYCSKLTGYAQIASGVKIVVEDATLKAAYESAQTIAKAQENAIQLALKAQRCGSRVKAVLAVRNFAKGLSVGQKKQILSDYTAIDGMLSGGSLDLARAEILLVASDGVRITDSDKTAMVAELDNCKP